LAERDAEEPEFPPAPMPPEVSQARQDDGGALPSADERPDLERPRPQPEPCSGIPGAPLARLHPELELDLQPAIDGRIEPGQTVPLTARIRNRSKDQHHAAVLPGDGSAVGWREPHVWWSGFVDSGDGCWRPIEWPRVSRCGIYDEEWRDEIVELAPGDDQVLPWLHNPSVDPEIKQGRVRFYLHYAYSARAPKASGAMSKSSDLRAMEGVAPFELVSEPIEFEIREALVLRLEARKRRRRGRVSKIGDVVTLHVDNVDGVARTIVPPNAGILEFEVIGTERRLVRAPWPTDGELRLEHALPAGASLPLLGKGSPDPTLTFEWSPPESGSVEIRALYQPGHDPMSPWLTSDWVELDLR